MSNLLALLASAFLFLLVKDLKDEKTAFRACIWLLAFPTAFYCGLIYTESLFLCLVTAFYYFSQRDLRLPTLSCAFLLSLSRPTGVLVALTLLAGHKTKQGYSEKPYLNRLLTILAYLLGFASYLCLMYFWTGDFFSGFSAQRFFISHNQFLNFLNPWNWFIENFIKNRYTWNGPQTSFFNRAVFLGVLSTLPFIYRHIGRNFFIYTLVLGLVPALLSDLMSYIRYAYVLFPLFILAAINFHERPYAKFIFLSCWLLQFVLLTLHSLNYWVG